MASTSAAQAAGLRIAIAQVRMHWSLEENLASILEAMNVASRHGARISAFAELALTGFHREIVALARPELVEPALQRVRDHAAALGQAVALGAPTFGPDGTKFNSHLLIDERGRIVADVRENGLTAPEATFFGAGSDRPSALLHGRRCTAVICREVEDRDAVLAQLDGAAPAIVFWPGQMRPDPAKPPCDPPVHVQQAQQLARDTGAHVVQTNWPNALNRPEESAGTGLSACIAPDGRLRFRLPEQGFGVGIFELGTDTFEWHPQ